MELSLREKFDILMKIMDCKNCEQGQQFCEYCSIKQYIFEVRSLISDYEILKDEIEKLRKEIYHE